MPIDYDLLARYGIRRDETEDEPALSLAGTQLVRRPVGREKKSGVDMSLLDFADNLVAGQSQADIPAPINPEDAALRQRAVQQVEGSVLPAWKAYAIEAGADIVSPVARLVGKGEYADRMNRFAGFVEQAISERQSKDWVPDILQRGLRGMGRSMTTMAPAAAIAGPYGAISAAAGQESNKAITEGRDAGLRGYELAGFAVTQGVIEAAPAAVMQKVGLGGVESLLGGKKTISVGVKEGIKQLGYTALQELPEELITEIGHNVAAAVSGVDPGALSAESLQRTVADTTVQTLMTVGFAGAKGVGQAYEKGKVAEVAAEMEAHTKEGRVPSRKQWADWKMDPKLGESRAQRKAYVETVSGVAEQMEDQVSEPEAAQPSVVPPTGGVTAPEAVQAPELPPAAEAVSEAPVAPEPSPGRVEVTEADNKVYATNKAGIAEIRETLGIQALSDEAVQTFDDVMNEVAASRADENALIVAGEAIRTGRIINTLEYAAAQVKTGKLLNELDAAKAERNIAGGAANSMAMAQAEERVDNITEDLDLLTKLDFLSGRETARAMSIRRLRLSRESFDVVSMLGELQKAVGPGGKLNKEQRSKVNRISDEGLALEAETKEMEEAEEISEMAANKIIAEKILTANRPKSVGAAVRKRAIAKREEIKKRIRQLGLRVNELTGVGPEGLWLIGRLGVTYAEEGVGTAIEIVERVKSDMSDLSLTDQEVYRAIASRDPRAVRRARTKAGKRVITLGAIARIHVELDEIARGVAVKTTTKRAPVDADLKALRAKLTKARLLYYASDADAARVERAINKLNMLQARLENGQAKIKKVPREVPLELQDIQEQIKDVVAEMRVDESIKEIQEKIRTGDFMPPPKRVKRKVNPVLERKQIRLVELRREYRNMVADVAPWTLPKVLKEVAYTLKATAATADISFTMRQNLWINWAHPVLAVKSFGPAMKTFFSEYTADQINNALLHSKNAALYELSGLAMQDAGSTDAKQHSEVFRARVLENTKIPILKQFAAIMKGSSRHAVTIGNLMRTSAFDLFIENNPNATIMELRAMADSINVATGLGNLGKLGAFGDELQVVFFSPRFAVSRIQTPFKLAQYWKYPRVRKQLAKDYVRVVSTGMLVLALADFAGLEVVWWDMDDPDWGKIRIGNTRLDIWGGFQQSARLIARLTSAAFIDDPTPPIELVGRFAAFKVSPVVSIVGELVTSKTAVGEDITKLESLATAPVPMVLRDVYEAWKEHGTAAGGGVGIWAGLGGGAATYEDSMTGTRRRVARLRRKGKYAEANRVLAEWNRRNPGRKIKTVKMD